MFAQNRALDFPQNESDQMIQEPGFSFLSSIYHIPYTAVWPRCKRNFQNDLPKNVLIPAGFSCHRHLHMNANGPVGKSQLRYYGGCQRGFFFFTGNGAKFSYANIKS